jgi:hypothetical protein
MSVCLAGIDYTTCLHVLQAYDDPDVRRLGNVRMCVGTCVPSCTGRSARLFFMLEARGQTDS